MEGKDNQKAPDISIDEALNLFLAVTYPNGIPEGMDKEQLMKALRQKIAKDRPGWAKTDEERTCASRDAGSPPDCRSYSQLKDEIARKAQQEDIPEDPEERYLYERRKEARQNREQKRAEEQEHQIREDLRKRLTAQKKEEDQETLEKAVLIREALEKRLRQTMKTPQTQSPAKQGKKPLSSNMQPLNMAGLTPFKNKPTPQAETANMKPPSRADLTPLKNKPTPQTETPNMQPPNMAPAAPVWESKTGKEGAREFFNSIKDLEPDEKVRSFQEFNRARRSNLKNRDELLSSRRPSRSDELMAVNMDKEKNKENETDNMMEFSLENKKSESRANNMAFSSNSKSSRLTLE